MSDVRLAWALDGRGDVVFASSMVGVDPRDRPRVTCPECDDVVTLKAGERGIVSPHVAHRSGAACAATAPETAAHLNAKMRLVRELSARGALRLRSECRRSVCSSHLPADDTAAALADAKARGMPECPSCGCVCDPEGAGGVCACDAACRFCSTDDAGRRVMMTKEGGR